MALSDQDLLTLQSTIKAHVSLCHHTLLGSYLFILKQHVFQTSKP